MNYKRIYDALMNRAIDRQLDGYTEKHHIIPRCMGGTDDSDNIVELTAKEHYMSHRLLVEIYPDNLKLKYAYWMMCTMETANQHRYKVSARIYEYAKKLLMTRSEETKRKISESLKHAYSSGKRKKRKNVKMDKSVGEKISKAKKGMIGTNKGIPMTEEQKQKIKATLMGHEVKQSTRDKISNTLLSRSEVTCPHCNKSSRGTSFKIYHFDNCKYKK
jgi:hypothetical protein